MPGAQPNFDLIARPYRWLEYLTLGPILKRTRTHHLSRLATSRHALLLGDGDGRFTAALLAANPQTHIHAVDISPVMLQLLRRNAARTAPSASSRLRTTNASALEITPSPDTDLIVTHFFLDCLPQPQVDALIARLAPLLPPQSLWLVSDFRIPSGPMHWPARLYVRLLYLAFRLLTGLRVTQLPDHATPLRHAGLHPIATHSRLFGLLTTELWQRSPQPQPRQPLSR